MDNSKNRQIDNLGVNKMGKNIRKSPIHQPNFGNNNAPRQQPQPQVYNISKNDFRDIVQQLTGSPSHSQEPPPRPPHHPPKPQNNRLQRIRPPPLTPINRHPMPPPMQQPPAAPPQVPYNNNNNSFPRPAQFGQPPPPNHMHPMNPVDMAGPIPTESPISAYMRYLQSSMLDPSPKGGGYPQPQMQPNVPLQGPGNFQPRPPPGGLLPNPSGPMLPSPRFNGPVPPPHMNAAHPHMPPNIPSPQPNGPPPLPSPTSQFLLPSPTAFFGVLSPRSPYPLLSPGMPFPYPLTPNFPFSPMPQSGILGPGPQPPPSPGQFPLSPSFFHISSPRWRDH